MHSLDKDLIEVILARLQYLRMRPWVSIRKDDPRNILEFFNGFYMCLDAITDDQNTTQLIWKQKGIRNSILISDGLESASPIAELINKGYKIEEIVDKLIVIEIQAWNKVTNELDE